MEHYNEIIDEIKRIGKAHKSFDSYKEKGSKEEAVTNSDVEIQRDLMKTLSTIYPDCGFYCEEEGYNKPSDKKYVFIIDPIDGTMNYTRNIPECAISVALMKNNELIFAAVYNIFKDEMFYAIKGKGAYFQGKKIKVSDKDFAHSIAYTGFSLYDKKYAADCFKLNEELYYKANDLRRFGSAALELCYIALGRGELYFSYRVFPYDYSGGELILKEAGGCLCSLHGKKVTHDGPILLLAANNKDNLDQLSNIVSKYIKYLPYQNNKS